MHQTLRLFFSPSLSLHYLKKHAQTFFFNIIGRRKPASIRPRGEGVYVAEFTPQSEGPHRIDVNWSDQPIRQRYSFFSKKKKMNSKFFFL